MFDLIEIIALVLSAGLIIFALIFLRDKKILSGLIWGIMALWPLLWAGVIRLPVPQTIIWMGMNIFAIVFIWQTFLGLLFKREGANIIAMPNAIEGMYKHGISLSIGLAFVALQVLIRF